MSDANPLEDFKRELRTELDLHRRETAMELNGIERWIQTASVALDKMVEIQVQLSTTREAQQFDRTINEGFRSDFKEDIRKLGDKITELERSSDRNSIRISLIVGAGMVALNVLLWAIGKFW